MKCPECNGSGEVPDADHIRDATKKPSLQAGDRVMVEATVRAIVDDRYFVMLDAYRDRELGYGSDQLHPMPQKEEE